MPAIRLAAGARLTVKVNTPTFDESAWDTAWTVTRVSSRTKGAVYATDEPPTEESLPGPDMMLHVTSAENVPVPSTTALSTVRALKAIGSAPVTETPVTASRPTPASAGPDAPPPPHPDNETRNSNNAHRGFMGDSGKSAVDRRECRR
ncbi:hypothetical protein GTY96_13280 [Corallococcus sp. c25j21]|nr:hypothetical protein [Corallococcus silvisoli]